MPTVNNNRGGSTRPPVRPAPRPVQGPGQGRAPAMPQRAAAPPNRAAAVGRIAPRVRPRSADDVGTVINAQRGRADQVLKNTRMFRARAGENVVRLLPRTWENQSIDGRDTAHFAYKVWMHKWIGADGSNFLCLKEIGEECPICELHQAERDRGDPDEAKKFRAQAAWLAYLLHRNGSNPTYPEVISMTDIQNGEITTATRDSGGITIYPEDMYDGYDLSFRRTQNDPRDVKTTRYGPYVYNRHPSPIHDDPAIMEQIINHIYDNPIPDLLVYHDADYIRRVLGGTQAPADNDLDDQYQQQDDQQPHWQGAQYGGEQSGEFDDQGQEAEAGGEGGDGGDQYVEETTVAEGETGGDGGAEFEEIDQGDPEPPTQAAPQRAAAPGPRRVTDGNGGRASAAAAPTQTRRAAPARQPAQQQQPRRQAPRTPTRR